MTSLLAMLSRSTERRRLSRDDKLAVYPRLAGASRALANIPVWPRDSEAVDREWHSVLEYAEQVAFLGSARVNAAVETLMEAAKNHRNLVAEIQHDSRPGHRDSVDRRFQEQYTTSVAGLRAAIDNFVRAGRNELEIRGTYRPIEGEAEQLGVSAP
ncbi:hypothetical protein [Nocardia cyriacigeorgica]|uniref:Uncharacterized protein n=1 Tax=Nocardia cyriacigeorgica TaxID=135487 RepID=A0A5R8NTZ6_9NOCA|nr:hypothetical protein [Nocardia cyriacigeorgica]TLF79082.1 hypothetical protein FEK34_06570 [Nocardia cyriacigeorgica]